jgi:hypothetical protein
MACLLPERIKILVDAPTEFLPSGAHLVEPRHQRHSLRPWRNQEVYRCLFEHPLRESRGCRAATLDGRSQRLGRNRPDPARPPYPGHCRAGPNGLAGALANAGGSKTSGYNARAGAEGTMSRYKRIIRDTLHSHSPSAQETETRIAVSILNRMLDLGRPDSVRAA